MNSLGRLLTGAGIVAGSLLYSGCEDEKKVIIPETDYKLLLSMLNVNVDSIIDAKVDSALEARYFLEDSLKDTTRYVPYPVFKKMLKGLEEKVAIVETDVAVITKDIDELGARIASAEVITGSQDEQISYLIERTEMVTKVYDSLVFEIAKKYDLAAKEVNEEIGILACEVPYLTDNGKLTRKGEKVLRRVLNEERPTIRADLENVARDLVAGYHFSDGKIFSISSEISEEILRSEKYFGEQDLYSAVGEKFLAQLRELWGE